MDRLVISQLPIENLRGKRVFVRIDADADEAALKFPLDEHKLRLVQPTLEHLLTVGARVVLATHLGDPGGAAVDSLRTNAVAEALSLIIRKTVRKLDEATGKGALTAVTEMQYGEVVLLENLRFYPGEDNNDEHFARELAELCDVYCDDAFAIAHCPRASTIAITRHVRPAAAGLALARELAMLEPLLDRPEAPFLGIVGGARIEEKFPLLETLLPKLDRLFIGGSLSFTFLKGRDCEIGAAPVDEALLPVVKDFLRKAEKQVEIILPEDFVVVHQNLFKLFEKSGRQIPVPRSREAFLTELLEFDVPVDIGPRTVKRIRQLVDSARTIFWNGPLGIWEIRPFAAGTRDVARILMEQVSPRFQHSVVCGNSLARAIRSFDLPFERMRHLTSGGESALQLLAGKPLPAVAALDSQVEFVAAIEPRPRRVLLAVDGSDPALEAAKQLGALMDVEGAEIILLHVQKPPDTTPEYVWLDAVTKRRREIERQLEGESILAAADAMLARQGLLSRKHVVVQGDAASEIVKSANEWGAELIAMGSRGRTGIASLFLGSVSRKVLDNARCRVLIARRREVEAADSETG
jgi:phosphoglycerate kinase